MLTKFRVMIRVMSAFDGNPHRAGDGFASAPDRFITR